MRNLYFIGLSVAAMVLINSAEAYAADFVVQDFGTKTGKDSIVEVTTGSARVVSDTMLIPPQAGIYKTFAKVGSTTNSVGGIIYVGDSANNPLGSSGAYCRGVATNAPNAPTKISPIVNYTGSAEFYTSFKVLFGSANAGGGVDTGKWQFGQGKNRTGTNSQFNMGNIVSTQGFAVIMFSFVKDDSVKISYRRGTGTKSTTGLTRQTLKQGVVYTIEIVGNNKDNVNLNYDYGDKHRALPPQRFDFYVNGELIGDTLIAARSDYMKVGDTINSISFDGTNSPSNNANIFLDDIKTWAAVPAVIPAYNENTENTENKENTGNNENAGNNGNDNQTNASSERTSALKVYPNIVRDGQLVIEREQTSDTECVEVYNAVGELMGVYFAGGSLSVIDLSALPSGLYFVRAGGKITKIFKM